MILKDFQQATSNRIVEIFKNKQNRVLLADEVGLGKTIVARDVIQQVGKWHKEDNDDHFKVIYICSNAAVANQNAIKLGINDTISVSQSRLSMQHLKIYQNQGSDHEYMQLIPMTPATSFTMTSGCGNKHERALMYVHLKRQDVFSRYSEQLKDMLAYGAFKHWNTEIEYYENKIIECNNNGSRYIQEMDEAITKHLQSHPNLIDIFMKIKDYSVDEISKYSKSFIQGLRTIFAEISLDKLEPDLVIMDEFQRFKDLINDEDSEQGMLTKKFFSNHETKILLLSATPYKPYSTLEEISEDSSVEHYYEFMKLMDFLFYDKQKYQNFKTVWNDFSSTLSQFDTSDFTVLFARKKDAQDALYSSVCRTERYSSGMIDDKGVCNVQLMEGDILSYTSMQGVLDEISSLAKTQNQHAPYFRNVPIDYVKSTPYLLSFMDSYKLKHQIMKYAYKNKLSSINKKTSKYLLVSKNRIHNYMQIPSNNAKLEYVKNMIFEQNKAIENLLWLPPSKFYYTTGKLFEKHMNASKVIIFSSWEMVPRMISTLLSYESERKTIGALFHKRKKKRGRGYFSNEKGRYGSTRLKGDTEDVLTYPCTYLSKLYQPKEYLNKSLTALKSELRTLIDLQLDTLCLAHNIKRGGSISAKSILNTMYLLDNVNTSIDQIPNDITNILVNLAIGGPASCSMRIFEYDKELSSEVTKKIFVHLFNKPESSAVIDLLYQNDKDYYQNVLQYCVDGHIQSMLDEYVHVLAKSKNELKDAMLESQIETSSIHVDCVESFANEDMKPISMRTHFSVGYFSTKKSDESMQRAENIRNAFNSPFRPFVLTTTSIGQEGLDFHNYASKIVHWNLPSNPIDLEQREGRINRYKCLAVRQNIAKKYSDKFTWDEMFEKAKQVEKQNSSDLVPYWYLPTQDDDSSKIERIVPMYPYSKDIQKYQHLIDVLSLYRLTLGQPRQEELVERLKCNSDDIDKDELFINLSPFDKY